MSGCKIFAALLISMALLAGTSFAHEYEGEYHGHYHIVAAAEGKVEGQMHMVIKKDGQLLGECKGAANGPTFHVSGYVDETGFCKGELKDKGVDIHIEGYVNLTKHDQLVGSLLQIVPPEKSDGAIFLSLNKQK